MTRHKFIAGPPKTHAVYKNNRCEYPTMTRALFMSWHLFMSWLFDGKLFFPKEYRTCLFTFKEILVFMRHAIIMEKAEFMVHKRKKSLLLAFSTYKHMEKKERAPQYKRKPPKIPIWERLQRATPSSRPKTNLLFVQVYVFYIFLNVWLVHWSTNSKPLQSVKHVREKCLEETLSRKYWEVNPKYIMGDDLGPTSQPRSFILFYYVWF